MRLDDSRPLHALLSQVLVAFTIELNNEFERRMRDEGYAGAVLSLNVWSTLLRFVAEGGVSVQEIAERALDSVERVKFQLGCLERWTFVVLEPDAADERPVKTRAHRLKGRVLRDGWGSGRGIRSGWKVRPTAKCRKAMEIWPPLLDEVERRWVARFGAEEIGAIRKALEEIAGKLEMALPQGLPGLREMGEAYPVRVSEAADSMPLPSLLSEALLAFTVEFEGESRVPLWLCANTLRALGEAPIPESEIPHLTGCSPETSGIGWQIKPFIEVEADPARRGKRVRLSPRGLAAEKMYRQLTAKIETRWEERFGKQHIRVLRDGLRALFVARNGERLLMSEGLIPDEGTTRAGTQTPALGRRDVGAAARKRMRDMVAQTAMFVRDPAGSLPHYPLWDMNRGFGP